MRPLLTLPLATAALLAAAPAALANTAVSRENGTFGSGLSGDYIWVTDPVSIGDKRMEVQVTRVGNEIKVTDANGAVNAHGDGCYELGAAVFCSAFGLAGIKIEGGNQNDKLSSAVDLPNVFRGDGGNDELNGGPNDDQFNGDAGADVEHGNGGTDSFVYEPGQDTLDGGADRDVVNYGGAPSAVSVRLDLTGFDDGVASERDRAIGIESASGSLYNDFLNGNADANTLRGRSGTDRLNGLDGNDLLDGMTDNDTIDGGAGLDTVTYPDRAAGVTVSLNDAAGDGEIGENDDVHSDVERIEGTPFGDTLTGSPSIDKDNTLNGNGGNDILNGGRGDDVANGGTGADKLIGDEGADDYNGDLGFDTVDYSLRSGEFLEDVEVTLTNSSDDNDGGPSDGPPGARDAANDVEGVITGAGADNITGSSPVANAVDAGPGDDVIDIRDGFNDSPVKCGLGTDTIHTDAFPVDFQTPLGALQLQDCENIVQPQPK